MDRHLRVFLGLELSLKHTSQFDGWYFPGRYNFQWLAEAMGGVHFAPTMFSESAVEILGRVDIITPAQTTKNVDPGHPKSEKWVDRDSNPEQTP